MSDIATSAITRLPFAIEDLELEIRKVCGGWAKIAIVLDPPEWEKVVTELINHDESQVHFVLLANSAPRYARFKGVMIVKGETQS